MALNRREQVLTRETVKRLCGNVDFGDIGAENGKEISFIAATLER